MTIANRLLTLTIGFLICSLSFSIAQRDTSIATKASAVQLTKHAKSKDDIQAIGTRKISSDRHSAERERQIGEKYSHLVEENANFITDARITEYVNRIGQNLVRNSDAKVPFTIKVIASEDINALALPGGFLYINSGLILATQNEAELAGVMAHEIAHVAAHHFTRWMARSKVFNLACIPLVFGTGGAGLAVQQALDVATPLGVTKFSRSFESEADYLGVEYMYKAGYDPQAFISFFERMRANETQTPSFLAKAFSTHPQSVDRIRKTQKEIAGILPPRDAYVVSTSDFDEVKLRLDTMENGVRTAQ